VLAFALALGAIGCSGASPLGPTVSVASAPRGPAASSPATAPHAPACGLSPGAPSARIGADKVAALRALADQTDTDAFVIVEDGHVILNAGNGDRRYELMSVSKSIVSLAVGALVDRERLSLDQPVADFVPAWRGTPKEAILVRHLLEHSSGLADERTTEKIYASADFVQFAIDAEAKDPPGTRFFYSNRAVNLLSGVVATASGQALDVWARESLFAPLGITDFGWSKDKAGNPHAMSGLQMRPLDVAKLGQLVLDDGRWCGTQVVSGAWLEASTRTYQKPGFQPHGLLWWLSPENKRVVLSRDVFDAWRSSGVPDAWIAKLAPLEGRTFDPKDFHQAIFTAMTGRTDKPTDADLEPYFAMTWKAGRPDAAIELGAIRSIVADGWGGQYIAIYPASKLVVVRLREINGPDDAKEPKRFLTEMEAILFPRPGG